MAFVEDIPRPLQVVLTFPRGTHQETALAVRQRSRNIPHLKEPVEVVVFACGALNGRKP
jgi:hypothetical protein